MEPKHRKPQATVVENVGLLMNSAARDLLQQDGEQFVGLAVAADGTIRMYPLKLGGTVVTVARIDKRIGASRVLLGLNRAVGTKFSCLWNDVEQYLELVPMELVPRATER